MRAKIEQVESFKKQARLLLRRHMRAWEYGQKDTMERLGLHSCQANSIMKDENSVSLERLLEALDRAGILFDLRIADQA